MNRGLIAELPQRIGEQVKIRGWVHALRDQKRVQFIVLRDESGLAQRQVYSRPRNSLTAG